MTQAERMNDYRKMLRGPFTKLCRLRFLQPDGSTAFALDNNPTGRFAGAFIADGSLSVNLNNGQRRTASVTLANLDGAFDYNINRVWFGNRIALDEGLVLSDGTDFYIQQGVFLAKDPVETVEPAKRTAQYDLVDKWADLDGTLFGYLESTYEVRTGTNVFAPIAALLKLDRGNGELVDNVVPVFTEYYNGKTQQLADGSTAKLTDAPYTLRVDSDKPLAWQFSQSEAELLGAAYTEKNTEVYNDFIVIGEAVNNSPQVAARAQNIDPASSTNVNRIGRKTVRYRAAGYSTKRQCEDLAVWKLKRSAVLQKSVSVSCSQIMHLNENELISIVRNDKPGSPVERHLVQGFTRPLTWSGPMQISAVSVQDFPTATVTGWPA